MNNDKIKNLILIFILLIIFPKSIFSSEPQNDEDLRTRNKNIIYTSPIIWSKYSNFESRTGMDSFNFTYLHGITNNLYLGLSYNSGILPEYTDLTIPRSDFKSFTIYDIGDSRKGEIISFKTQYFYFNDFYFSLNVGLEKSYSTEINKYLISNNEIEIEPLIFRTINSNRLFSTVGLGYRLEFFSNFLIGLEVEYGVVGRGKRRNHYFFSPENYSESTSSLLLEKILLMNSGDLRNNFHIISFYLGISF